MRPKPWAAVVAIASLAGLSFAAVSTRDFVAHLDRQVHGIHCSFLPGLMAADVSGTSGCYATMMSPYASVWDTRIWGGVPIALPAMAVFAFLLFWVGFVVLTRRQQDVRATGFLLAATGLPLLASLVMGGIAAFELGAACKLCIGIYVASLAAAVGAFGLWHQARSDAQGRTSGEAPGGPSHRQRHVDAHAPTLMLDGGDLEDGKDPPFPGETATAAPEAPKTSLSLATLAVAFGVGVIFVLVPVVTYAAMAPDFSRYAEGCGKLSDPEGADAVLVPLGGSATGVDVVEVLDPLCPACRGFEQRFSAWARDHDVQRRALLFPLDDRCNWMVDQAIHPGACAVSEAMLCADRDAAEVLEWAFAEQDAILEAAAQDPKAVERMIAGRFPDVRDCVGKPAVRARLNRALRWAVANELPVLTPQVYLAGKRLCDEDTDLGMSYVLTRMIANAESQP